MEIHQKLLPSKDKKAMKNALCYSDVFAWNSIKSYFQVKIRRDKEMHGVTLQQQSYSCTGFNDKLLPSL